MRFDCFPWQSVILLVLTYSYDSLFANAPPGVVIASTDVLLHIPPDLSAFTAETEVNGVMCLGIRAPSDYGTRHGVFVTDDHMVTFCFRDKYP